MTKLVTKDISTEQLDVVIVRPGTLVTFGALGIQVNADYDDEGEDGIPYVSVNTESIDSDYKYSPATTLKSHAKPFHAEFTSETSADEGFTVWGPFEHAERRFAQFPIVTTIDAARTAATIYAETLNSSWSEQCGAPIISIHLNDVELYCDSGEGNTASVAGTPTVYAVRPDDLSEDVAIFANEADAAKYRETFDSEAVGDIERVIICDSALAKEMISNRSDNEIALTTEDMADLERGGVINAAAENGGEITLKLADGEAETLKAGGTIHREEFDTSRGEDKSYNITYHASEASS